MIAVKNSEKTNSNISVHSWNISTSAWPFSDSSDNESLNFCDSQLKNLIRLERILPEAAGIQILTYQLKIIPAVRRRKVIVMRA